MIRLRDKSELNDDFVDMLFCLLEAGAEFLIVGAHALAAHGIARATGDIDILVRGVPFEDAWAARSETVIAGFAVVTLGLESLRKNKAAAGRDKDLEDLKALERLKPG